MRLSSSNTSLITFEHDVNVSAVAKSECFKFLAVILKNLLKSDDPKFRQLRLSNAKIQRITAHAAVMSFLQQTACFDHVQENGESLLRIHPISRAPSQTALESALKEVTAAQERVEFHLPRTVSHSSSNASLSSACDTLQPRTEKQKARKLAEEQAVSDKEAARVARKRTVSQIKADKHVRENDPNWKPSVSAAAAKSGDVSITTFRDKFGENDE
jgi:hypothetical protein